MFNRNASAIQGHVRSPKCRESAYTYASISAEKKETAATITACAASAFTCSASSSGSPNQARQKPATATATVTSQCRPCSTGSLAGDESSSVSLSISHLPHRGSSLHRGVSSLCGHDVRHGGSKSGAQQGFRLAHRANSARHAHRLRPPYNVSPPAHRQ